MASMRKAINQHCKDCIYDSAVEGAWRMQVEGCTVTRCALFELRPRSSPKRIKSNVDLHSELLDSFEV